MHLPFIKKIAWLILLLSCLTINIQAQQVIKEYKIKYLISSDVLQKFQQINRNVQIFDHREGNHLILTGDSIQVMTALKQLEFVDIEQKLVTIEFMLVEYIHDESFRWEFDIQQGKSGNFGGGAYNPGSFGFAYNSIDNLLPQFQFNLQALVNEGKAKVVTNPHLVVQSGDRAEINLKDTRYLQVQQAGFNGTNISFQQISAGIDLVIIPTATHDSIIHLELDGRISEFLPLALSNSSAALTEESNQIKTHVDVRDGQTLIIGGLVQEELIEVDAGFPFLRKIPVLGLFFNKKENITLYVEKVIYITCYINGAAQGEPYHMVREMTALEKETEEIIETDPDFTKYKELKKSFKRQKKKNRNRGE